jgi:hypothetical protein
MKLAMLLLPGALLAQTDWIVPPEYHAAGYVKEKRGRGYVLSGPGPSGAMAQTFDAAPYRGFPVRLRAAVRVEGEGTAQLLLRVDRVPGELGFYDNMGDRPIRAGEWAPYELFGEVAPDARTIELGVLSSGKADVWVDQISFEKLPPSTGDAAARSEIERIYARVDAAYVEGDSAAVARLAAPDAQVVIRGARTPLAKILAQIGSTKFRSRSKITALRIAGGEATAWVNNESTTGVSGMFSSSRDTWIQTAKGWKLKQSTLVASRPFTAPEVLAEIKERSGMPDWAGVRILLWQGDFKPVPGFTVAPPLAAPAASAATALRYLKQHAPDAAGLAELAFQANDAARIAKVVHTFDENRAGTAEWLFARQAAVAVYQSLTMPREEAAAANIIWLASQAYPDDKILVVTPDASAAAPRVRKRYGKGVYLAVGAPRELLGGEYFVDLRSALPESVLGQWSAAQKFDCDGIFGQ